MKELLKALADFQQEVPTINKNAEGYNFKFADLEQVNNVIKPLLKKNDLVYTQPLDGTNLKTILYHIPTGQSIESFVVIPQDVQLKGQNTFQALGSGITYLRRYSLYSILGLVTDEDADAYTPQAPSPENSSDSKVEQAIDSLKKAKTADELKRAYIATGVLMNDSRVKAVKDERKEELGIE